MPRCVSPVTSTTLVSTRARRRSTSFAAAASMQGASSAEFDGLVNCPIVLEVDSVSVQGMVDRVSIAVRERERVSLAGLAGSGRSKLAGLIVGRRKPTEGGTLCAAKHCRRHALISHAELGSLLFPRIGMPTAFAAISRSGNISRFLSCAGSADAVFIMSRTRRELASSMIERLQIKVSDPTQNAAELSRATSRRPHEGHSAGQHQS
jgi:ABC-type sugar transport system ATPase subunit